jgi:hypothetical protein
MKAERAKLKRLQRLEKLRDVTKQAALARPPAPKAHWRN